MFVSLKISFEININVYNLLYLVFRELLLNEKRLPLSERLQEVKMAKKNFDIQKELLNQTFNTIWYVYFFSV